MARNHARCMLHGQRMERVLGDMVILIHSTESILSKAEGLRTRAPRRI